MKNIRLSPTSFGLPASLFAAGRQFCMVVSGFFPQPVRMLRSSTRFGRPSDHARRLVDLRREEDENKKEERLERRRDAKSRRALMARRQFAK
jgi:hypothetical protein